MMNEHRFTMEGLKDTIARLLKENDELRLKLRIYEENVGKIAINPKSINEQKNK
jgi:regulator of replication initiation timing|tara:strand:- start:801 stop:962 length:162 start_codon:yes stop_codon:yes gene_type:complete